MSVVNVTMAELHEKLAKAHEPVAAKKHPAFEKMRFPSHQLADQVAHAIALQLSVVFSLIFRPCELQ